MYVARIIRSPLSAHLLAAGALVCAALQHRPTARPTIATPQLAIAVAAGRGRRTADRPVHPRDRHADRRGAGRRRGRDGRPRRLDAGRARHAGQPRAPSSSGCRRSRPDASLKEAEANAAQIEARLALPAERRVRREQGARGRQRPRQLRARRVGVRAASRSCWPSASSRSRSTTSARRRSKRRASSSSRRRTAPNSSIRRCRRRARA